MPSIKEWNVALSPLSRFDRFALQRICTVVLILRWDDMILQQPYLILEPEFATKAISTRQAWDSCDAAEHLWSPKTIGRRCILFTATFRG